MVINWRRSIRPSFTREIFDLVGTIQEANRVRIRHLGHRNVASLERIATALYVSAHGSAGSSRVGEIVALKPHVDIVLAEKAVEELDKMKNDALNERLIPA